jgi:hypothetical protein
VFQKFPSNIAFWRIHFVLAREAAEPTDRPVSICAFVGGITTDGCFIICAIGTTPNWHKSNIYIFSIYCASANNTEMKNPLCQYKDLFGTPGTTAGLRKYRLFGIALLDVSVTLACAILFAWTFRLPYLQTIVAIFILGVFVHRIFCVRTAIDKMLFS